MQRSTRIIVCANQLTIKALGRVVMRKEKEQVQRPSMRQHLDPPSDKYNDYLPAHMIKKRRAIFSRSSMENIGEFGEARVTRAATIADDTIMGGEWIYPIFDPEGPSPDIAREEISNRNWAFLVDIEDEETGTRRIRPVDLKETCRIMGAGEATIERMMELPKELAIEYLRRTTPRATLQEVLAMLYKAEKETETAVREEKQSKEQRESEEKERAQRRAQRESMMITYDSGYDDSTDDEENE